MLRLLRWTSAPMLLAALATACSSAPQSRPDGSVTLDMSVSDASSLDGAPDDLAPADLLSPADGPLTRLALSASSLALAVGGKARTLTITNTGATPASAVGYATTPALPSGTSIAPVACGDLAPGDSCVLTITPGATPSAAPGDTNATPITLTVSGGNSASASATVRILGYGSVYQGGYVFALDDSTAATASIGGKVAALTDQGSVPWSSDGQGGVSNVAIAGISDGAVAPPCNAATDGACDTMAIVTYYSPPTTSPAVPLVDYAAGLCKATIAGFSDWYLPSICELGYDAGAIGTGCGSAAAPTLQNMQSNLLDNNVGGLNGLYWSATQSAGPAAASTAWLHYALGPHSTQQATDTKAAVEPVRCARAITP